MKNPLFNSLVWGSLRLTSTFHNLSTPKTMNPILPQKTLVLLLTAF